MSWPPIPLRLCLMLVLALPATARADEGNAENFLSNVQLHGLVSQGALLTTKNNYLAHTERGSVDFTEAGFNITKPLDENLTLGLQLFSGKLGAIGSFFPNLDWYYFDWHRFDWLKIRAGRIKLPYGLYNEQTDYDPGHFTILMPQSVYPITVRDLILAATGAEVRGYIDFGKGGALSYNLVGGAIFVNLTRTAPTGETIDVPFTWCGRLIWEAPVTGLRIGASALGTRFNVAVPVPDLNPPEHAAPATSLVPTTLDGLLWVGSVEYTTGRLHLAGEYSHWNVVFNSPKAIPPGSTSVQERFYVSGDYYFIEQAGVGLYYSAAFPDIAHRFTQLRNHQHDVALSFRWDITRHWLLKAEAHYLNGTAALDGTLNGTTNLNSLAANWALFALKASAYF